MAGNLFDTYGIKAVRIDDIAFRLKISKKTIYENFQSKDEIVLESVRADAEKGMAALKKAGEKADSPLEAVLQIHAITLEQAINHCPAFFRDLEAYPETKHYVYNKYISFVGAKYVRLFCRCAADGLFIQGLDKNLILGFFHEQLRLTAEKYHAGQRQSPAAYINIITTFLNGICTDKGRAELNRLKSGKISKK